VTPPPLLAELLEDAGEAAAGEEFFRAREFLAAETVTHTLRIAGDGIELLVPLIVRAIGDGPERDATSPYGYPGLTPAASPLDPAAVDFSATGLVSAFIRHALGDPPLVGASPRNVVQIADPSLPPKSRGSDRNQINKNLRRGYEVRIVPGPETTAADRAGFHAAYEETMRRAGAADRYFFGAGYFDRILESGRTWLALAHAPDGEVAAASVAAQSDGFLHYYLSGSGDRHLRDSPMKNVVASLIGHAAELRLPLNLGGGISRGDRLEEFKRGFANRELPWRTSEIVCDPPAYERLAAGRDAGDFFPAYRAAVR
jgi:GNAT acetyltransferase-like protein